MKMEVGAITKEQAEVVGELLGNKNNCQDKECPYYWEAEDCPARAGCGGYEGADTISVEEI